MVNPRGRPALRRSMAREHNQPNDKEENTTWKVKENGSISIIAFLTHKKRWCGRRVSVFLSYCRNTKQRSAWRRQLIECTQRSIPTQLCRRKQRCSLVYKIWTRLSIPNQGALRSTRRCHPRTRFLLAQSVWAECPTSSTGGAFMRVSFMGGGGFLISLMHAGGFLRSKILLVGKLFGFKKLETASAADSHFQLGFLVQAPTVALVCALQAARLGILSPPCAQPTSYVYCPASALARTWWFQWLTARWTLWAPEESYAGPPWVDKWQWCILVLRCSTSSKTWTLHTIFKIMIAIRVFEKFLLCICSTSCRSHRDDYGITDVYGVLELDGEEVCALRLLPSDASRGIGPPGVSPQFMSTHCVVVSMRETNVFECPTGLPMHLSQLGSINK